MVQNMKDNSRTTTQMGKEERYMQMENTTRENSKMTNAVDMEFIKILMEDVMKEIGMMINNMVRAKKFGTMELRPMKETL